jgi:hypothetical protein
VGGDEVTRMRDLCQAGEGTVCQYHSPGVGGQAGAGCLDRCRILIQAQETPVGRRGRQDPGRVPPSSHRRIYVSATWPDLQAIENRLEKNRDVGPLHPFLSLRVEFTSTTAGPGLFAG